LVGRYIERGAKRANEMKRRKPRTIGKVFDGQRFRIVTIDVLTDGRERGRRGASRQRGYRSYFWISL
jgi:hypothetical protein